MKKSKLGTALEKEQVTRSMRNIIDQKARDIGTGAQDDIVRHETLCEERWKNQLLSMGRMETSMAAIQVAMNDRIGRTPAVIIATLTGLVGFLAARAFPLHG